jgi:hypothetical protein
MDPRHRRIFPRQCWNNVRAVVIAAGYASGRRLIWTCCRSAVCFGGEINHPYCALFSGEVQITA